MNIDLYFFNLIFQFAGRWAWLDYSAMFFAQYFEYFLWAAMLAFIVFPALCWSASGGKKYWKMVLEAVIAAAVTRFVLAEAIRWIWFRPRPFVALNFVPLVQKSAEESAFPSGHASFYFALSTIVYFYNKKAGIVFYIASFLIVISRVFVGIHWPADILAGAAIGIFMGWILNRLFRQHANKLIKSYNRA